MAHENSAIPRVAARESAKARTVEAQLAAIAIPNLVAMGFPHAAEAFERRPLTETFNGEEVALDLNGGVYRYVIQQKWSDRVRATAQRFTWPLDKIAMIASSPRGNVSSGPIVDRRFEMGTGSLTTEQFYTMLGLQAVRDAAEVKTIPLPLQNTAGPIRQSDLPEKYRGAYREERTFNSGIPEADLQESVNYFANGSIMNNFVITTHRTEFGLVVPE
jgi:hypothetical protein